MALKDLHLAELHRRARELDVPRFRLLTKPDLVAAIEERGGEAPGAEEPPEERVEEEPERPAEERAEEPPEGPAEERAEEEVETEEVTGVLDRMPQGYGFLRLHG